jgi:hypothetical protein
VIPSIPKLACQLRIDLVEWGFDPPHLDCNCRALHHLIISDESLTCLVLVTCPFIIVWVPPLILRVGV